MQKMSIRPAEATLYFVLNIHNMVFTKVRVSYPHALQLMTDATALPAKLAVLFTGRAVGAFVSSRACSNCLGTMAVRFLF